MAACASKRQSCDTELRLGAPPCARENKKAAATTSAAAAPSNDGGRVLLQQLVVSARGGDGDSDGVRDVEVQASAIMRMARGAAGARPSDRGAARRMRSLRLFLHRRRVARGGRGGASSPSSSSCC